MKSWIRIIALNALAAGMAWVLLDAFMPSVIKPLYEMFYGQYADAGYGVFDAALAAAALTLGFLLGFGLLLAGMCQMMKPTDGDNRS